MFRWLCSSNILSLHFSPPIFKNFKQTWLLDWQRAQPKGLGNVLVTRWTPGRCCNCVLLCRQPCLVEPNWQQEMQGVQLMMLL
jgi:hypothetical protein